jgi:hypothetical protein
MTSAGLEEARLDQLAQLPMRAPDSARASRTRRRCRALLERRERRRERRASQIDAARQRLGPLVVGAICVFFVVYLATVVATAIHLQGLFRARLTP